MESEIIDRPEQKREKLSIKDIRSSKVDLTERRRDKKFDRKVNESREE